MMETGLTIYDRLAEQDILKVVEMMGNAMARSGMFGITKPEQGIILALTSLMERKSVTELARKFHIIEGRLSMRADAMQAEFQAGGGRITWKQTNETICEAVFSHPEYCPEGVAVKITMDELKKTGVATSGGKLKGTYEKHPRQMLRARVISEGVRMVDPGVIVGVYTPEEVSDFRESAPSRPVDAKFEALMSTPEPAEATVEDLIPGGKHESAEKYLQSIDWLAAGETLEDLKPGHRQMIQKNTARFLAAVNTHAAGEAADE
jgi:hypothetical protein